MPVQEAQMMDESEGVFKNFLVSHIYTTNQCKRRRQNATYALPLKLVEKCGIDEDRRV